MTSSRFQKYLVIASLVFVSYAFFGAILSVLWHSGAAGFGLTTVIYVVVGYCLTQLD